VLEFSQRLARLSDGAFDVTVQPLWLLFTRCKADGRLPSGGEIARARSLVGWRHLEVSPRAIACARPGMSITLNGVAQGYATDLAVAALRSRGIRDALIDTGEMGAEGGRGPGHPWTVGIQHPRDPSAILASVEMDGRFLATSGDYATTFTPDFVHHHIFDPHAGVSPRALSSVAVAAASGMEADGLTKPMMVLEPARAQRLLSRFPGAGAVFIDKRGGIVASPGLRLALCLLFALGSVQARAGEPVVEEIDVRAPTRLPEAGVAADGLDVEVIDAKHLHDLDARTLQEALQRLAGVHLSDEQGNVHQQDLFMRGFSASPVTGVPQGISVFVDGVRVNEPAVEEVNFDLIPLADVERVEIIRGANAIFGRNTLGGAIHIVTRRGGGEPKAEVELRGGSSTYQEARGAASGSWGPLDGYLSLGEFSDRSWRVEGGGRGLRAFGKLGLAGEGGTASLSFQLQQDRLQQPGSLPESMLQADRRQNYTPGDFFKPSLQLVNLNARTKVARGLSAGVNAFVRALQSEQYNASWISADTRLFNRTLTAGAAMQIDHVGHAGPLRNQLTLGVEATHSSVRITAHEEPNAGFAAFDEKGALPRVTSDVADGQWGLGAFVQEHARVTDGFFAGLGATAALRFDRIAHDILDTSPDDPGKATGTAVYSALVPALGLSWTLAPAWHASASWSSGFRPPAFLELTCGDPTAPCIGLQAGVAPDTALARLRPVRSQALSAGVAASVVDGVEATLTAFRTGVRDEIYSVALPGTTRVFFQNVGSTRRTGMELAVHAERGALAVDAAYAYTLATFTSDLVLATQRTADGVESIRAGAEIPLTPNHRLKLDARVATFRWLILSSGIEYVGSQVFRGDEANAAPRIHPYLTLRAGAEARWRAWTATLQASNLLDTRYETFGAFAPDGRLPGRPIEPFLTPGAPLRILLALRWNVEAP
jgi:outer membrane receptor protein involved in Fe transport